MLGVHIAHLGVVFQRNAPASSSRLVVGPEEEEGDDKAGKNRENRGGGDAERAVGSKRVWEEGQEDFEAYRSNAELGANFHSLNQSRVDFLPRPQVSAHLLEPIHHVDRVCWPDASTRILRLIWFRVWGSGWGCTSTHGLAVGSISTAYASGPRRKMSIRRVGVRPHLPRRRNGGWEIKIRTSHSIQLVVEEWHSGIKQRFQRRETRQHWETA